MTALKQTFFQWSGVIVATVLMILMSGLILYPQPTNESVFIALRISSLTTAIPFLLIFIARSITTINAKIGQWLQNNRRYLWLTLTISHLIHLYQIWLYYQLGQSCPVTVWLVTLPLWIITVSFAVVEIINPQIFDRPVLNWIYKVGVWYVWLIFTLAFGLGTVGNHLLFYNLPAFILFLAGAIFSGIVWWRRIFPKVV